MRAVIEERDAFIREHMTLTKEYKVHGPFEYHDGHRYIQDPDEEKVGDELEALIDTTRQRMCFAIPKINPKEHTKRMCQLIEAQITGSIPILFFDEDFQYWFVEVFHSMKGEMPLERPFA